MTQVRLLGLRRATFSKNFHASNSLDEAICVILLLLTCRFSWSFNEGGFSITTLSVKTFLTYFNPVVKYSPAQSSGVLIMTKKWSFARQCWDEQNRMMGRTIDLARRDPLNTEPKTRITTYKFNYIPFSWQKLQRQCSSSDKDLWLPLWDESCMDGFAVRSSLSLPGTAEGAGSGYLAVGLSGRVGWTTGDLVGADLLYNYSWLLLPSSCSSKHLLYDFLPSLVKEGFCDLRGSEKERPSANHHHS